MVLVEFLEQAKNYQWVDYVGMEDYADKLSFNVSTSLMTLFTIIIVAKSYLFESISCYIPIKPSGENFDDFLKSYCWVHGTIPIFDKDLPNHESKWLQYDKDHRLNYYQWVPFMLSLQGVLFYLPRIIWQIITYNLSGVDLESIVKMARNAANQPSDKDESVKQIVENLYLLIFGRKPFEKRSKLSSLKQNVLFGKRSGRRLVMQYMFVKILYLVNVIGQLFMMHRFLGFGAEHSFFGWKVLSDIRSGKEWNDTLIFPRVTFCYLDKIQHVGLSNDYLAQCVLPINMLNEKIYIFLWFWNVIVCALSLLSFFQWLYRIFWSTKQINFIRKFFKYRHMESDRETLARFKVGFLRSDGVFITYMLSINAGNLITSDIITRLWTLFKENNPDDSKYNIDDDHGFSDRLNNKDATFPMRPLDNLNML